MSIFQTHRKAIVAFISLLFVVMGVTPEEFTASMADMQNVYEVIIATLVIERIPNEAV